MKKILRVISFLLIFALLCTTFAACGNGSTGKSDEGDTPPEDTRPAVEQDDLNLNVIDTEVENEIKQAYYTQCSEQTPHGATLPEDFSIDDLSIEKYYGEYDGSYAVMLGGLGYEQVRYCEIVDGVVFSYESANRIMIYNEGSLYSLTDAYLQGYLTRRNLLSLTDIHWQKQIFTEGRTFMYGPYYEIRKVPFYDCLAEDSERERKALEAFRTINDKPEQNSIVAYCGQYGNAYVYRFEFPRADFFDYPYQETIGGVQIIYRYGRVVWVYSETNDKIYSLREAYDIGLLTSEDLISINNYPIFRVRLSPAKLIPSILSNEVENQIKQAYYTQCSEQTPHGATLSEDFSIDDLSIEKYYGEYDGSYAVMLGGLGYEQVRYCEIVDGVVFSYESANRIMIYNEGSLYSLTDAYLQGYLTRRNLLTIAYSYPIVIKIKNESDNRIYNLQDAFDIGLLATDDFVIIETGYYTFSDNSIIVG